MLALILEEFNTPKPDWRRQIQMIFMSLMSLLQQDSPLHISWVSCFPLPPPHTHTLSPNSKAKTIHPKDWITRLTTL